LLLRVLAHERNLRLGASREPEIIERHVVDREDAAGGAVLRGHVRDRGAVGERKLAEAVAEELDELLDDAALAQHLVTVSTRSVAVAPSASRPSASRRSPPGSAS
jgi:hypothetical protein